MKIITKLLLLNILFVYKISFAGLVSDQKFNQCLVRGIDVCALASEAASRINLTLPKTLGNITYERISATGSKIIHEYSVSYNLNEAKEITNFTPEEMKDNQRKMAEHFVCDDNDVRRLLEYGITIVYIYKFKDGDINRIVISNCLNR